MKGFSCSQCHFQWERLRKQQIHPAAPVTQSSRWVVTASTWEKRANAQREPQEAPHTVRVWSVIPTAKMLEKEEGSFLRIISNRIAHKMLLTRTSFQNFMFAPNFEPGPPAKVSWALWQCYRDQAVRRGVGGVWTTHHSYSSVCLRLLSWGGGQTMSTLSSMFQLQEWLNVERSFWLRGVFSLAYCHLKSSLHLSVEVEVRGLINAWKPGLLRAVSGKLASSATSPRRVSFDWFGFKSFPKWKSLALSISCEYCLSQDQSVNRNGGVWSRQTLQEASYCALLGPPSDCSIIATKDAAQQATASGSDTEKIHLLPSALHLPSLGKGKTLTSPQAEWSPDGPHQLEPAQGNRI